jgi:hypothetical protein
MTKRTVKTTITLEISDREFRRALRLPRWGITRIVDPERWQTDGSKIDEKQIPPRWRDDHRAGVFTISHTQIKTKITRP